MMRYVIWITVIIMAILLRVWLATSKELSFDESFTITLGLGLDLSRAVYQFSQPVMQHPVQILESFSALKGMANLANLSVYLADLNPPLYFLITGPWILATSMQTLWLRLPVVIMSLGSAYYFYRLLTRFVSKTFALFGLAVMAFSSIHLFYGALARPYEMMLLLALVATLTLLNRNYKLYSLWIGLGLFTHLFFAFMIPIHVLYLVIVKEFPQNWKAYVRSLILPLLAGVGWVGLIFSQQIANHAQNAIFNSLPLWKLLWHHAILSRWIFYCDKPLPRWNHFELDMVLSAFIWCLLMFEGYRCYRGKGICQEPPLRSLFCLGAVWFFMPILLLTGLDFSFGSRLSGTERYLYLFSPGMIMMLVTMLASYHAKWQKTLMILLSLLIALNTGCFIRNGGLPTEGFQTLSHQIQQDWRSHDLILAMSGYPSLPIMAPYLPTQSVMLAKPASPKQLSQLLHGYQRVWLVVTYGQMSSLEPVQQTLALLDHLGFKPVRKISMGNIRLAGYLLSR